MNLLCTLLGHQRALPAVHNDGVFFTSCTRCGVDMTRERRGPWRAVPPGMQVVWRTPAEHRAIYGEGNRSMADPGLIKGAALQPLHEPLTPGDGGNS